MSAEHLPCYHGGHQCLLYTLYAATTGDIGFNSLIDVCVCIYCLCKFCVFAGCLQVLSQCACYDFWISHHLSLPVIIHNLV
jgi:hypothetical protein